MPIDRNLLATLNKIQSADGQNFMKKMVTLYLTSADNNIKALKKAWLDNVTISTNRLMFWPTNFP